MILVDSILSANLCNMYFHVSPMIYSENPRQCFFNYADFKNFEILKSVWFCV